MKQYLILFILVAALYTLPAAAQYTQNFDAANALTSGCTVVSNTDRTILAGEIIGGTGSLYSNPPVNGSGTRDYSTPYLNIVDPLNAAATTTSFTVSFNYKLNETLNGQATRYIEIGLQGRSDYTALTTIIMDKDNDPVVSTLFTQTFTVPVGTKRLVLKMGGSNGNGTVRIIIDNLVASANPYYTFSGTCNTAPAIQNDVYFTSETNTYTGTSVLVNDSDPNGESLSAPTIVTPSPDGTVVLNADGSFTFTANLGFMGSVTSFTYQVYDNGFDPVAGTATVTIYFQSLIILPLKILSFQGALVNNKAQLKWAVEENETGDRFDIEKSTDGRNFSVISTLAVTSKSGSESYVYNEGTILNGGAYYRIRVRNKDNTQSYTKVVYLRGNGQAGGLTLLQNPVQSSIAFTYTVAAIQPATVNLYNAFGAKMQSFKLTLQKGTNTIIQPLTSGLVPGAYVLEVITPTDRAAVKLIK
jgi:hypothetical protein